jgi:hypothetical protein
MSGGGSTSVRVVEQASNWRVLRIGRLRVRNHGALHGSSAALATIVVLNRRRRPKG